MHRDDGVDKARTPTPTGSKISTTSETKLHSTSWTGCLRTKGRIGNGRWSLFIARAVVEAPGHLPILFLSPIDQLTLSLFLKQLPYHLRPQSLRYKGIPLLQQHPPPPIIPRTPAMATLSRLLSPTQSPFLRTLLPSIGLAYALQAAVAAPSIAFQTERFYDLSGSLTYISCTALSLYLPTLRARYAASLSKPAATKPGWPSLLQTLTAGTSGSVKEGGLWNWRMLAVSACVGIWAGRLGTYLFSRINEEKKDSRFDGMRGKPLPFLGAFAAQATVRYSP